MLEKKQGRHRHVFMQKFCLPLSFFVYYGICIVLFQKPSILYI